MSDQPRPSAILNDGGALPQGDGGTRPTLTGGTSRVLAYWPGFG
jgi:hypothetical protein